MSRWIVGLLGTLLLPALIAAGCAGSGAWAPSSASSQEATFAQHNVGKYFASHRDQGLRADMSFSDVDFLPHSSALSGTGEARLLRYADLLAGADGRLNYDASTTDQKLIESRMETARLFLADATSSDHTIKIVLGLPGGRGMSGKDALAAREVAAEPEPRNTAYQLSDTEGNRESGS